MHWLGLSNLHPEPPERKAQVMKQMRDQERRIQAIDRALAVIQRHLDEDAPRVDL